MFTVKAGIAFPLTLDTIPDRTDITPESFVVKYSLANSTNVPTVSAGNTVEKGDGAYVHMLTINQVGYYTINVLVPGDGATYEDDNVNISVLVTNATVDDVYDYVAVVDGKIDSIKTQVDLLDEATLNGLNAQIGQVQTKLADITALISDENDPGITSLKELLQQLSDSVGGSNNTLSAIQTYITAATDDIENMIAGTDTLADGTPNPFKGNTNIDIMAALSSMGVTLQQAIDAVKTAVEAKIDAAKAELVEDIAAVETLVSANKSLLESDVFGLAKLMSTMEAFKTAETNHFTSVTSDLSAISQAISSMNGAMSTKLDTIEGKIDTVTSYVKRRQQTRIV